MTSEKQKIIEKLKKLAALSDSPNAFEAQSAKDKLNELLASHELTVDAVYATENETVAIKHLQYHELVDIPRPTTLSGYALTNILFAASIYSRYNVSSLITGGSYSTNLIGVGYESNFEIFRHIVNLLVRQGINAYKSSDTQTTFDGFSKDFGLFMQNRLKETFWANFGEGCHQKLVQILGDDEYALRIKYQTSLIAEIGMPTTSLGFDETNALQQTSDVGFKQGTNVQFSDGVSAKSQKFLE